MTAHNILNAKLRAVQVAFWSAAIVTVAAAIRAPQFTQAVVAWDKANHFLAFYVLAILASAAFPQRNLILIAIALSIFGASIELVQGFKIVARDRDFWDWVADSIAIGLALAPMYLVRRRTQYTSIRAGTRSAI